MCWIQLKRHPYNYVLSKENIAILSKLSFRVNRERWQRNIHCCPLLSLKKWLSAWKQFCCLHQLVIISFIISTELFSNDPPSFWYYYTKEERTNKNKPTFNHHVKRYFSSYRRDEGNYVPKKIFCSFSKCWNSFLNHFAKLNVGEFTVGKTGYIDLPGLQTLGKDNNFETASFKILIFF